MIYFLLSMVCFLVGGLLIGYLWGEARGIRATECRWSDAVKRAAWPRRALQSELPPSARREWDRVDQPNGTCSACGAPLNAQLMGGYRLHAHLHRPLTEVQFRPGRVLNPEDSPDWMTR